jgi:hypothetical protein
LSVVVHVSGSDFSDETPDPCGPRHAGQFSATADKVADKTRRVPTDQTIALLVCDVLFIGNGLKPL